MGKVTGFDLETARGRRRAGGRGHQAEHSFAYDTLVVAGGSSYAYFGHERVALAGAGGQVTRQRAEVRGRILQAFEAAELERRPRGARRAG